MQTALAFGVGLIFGTGLLLAGMSNTAKVLNFFDFAGHWDPSLGLVMGSALTVTAIGYWLVLQRDRPLLAPRFIIPGAKQIDLQLIAGSAVFGVGWGLSGFCPGGLIPALGLGRAEPFIFFAGLLIGLTATRTARSWSHRRRAAPARI
jgi:uncharacterized protein